MRFPAEGERKTSPTGIPGGNDPTKIASMTPCSRSLSAHGCDRAGILLPEGPQQSLTVWALPADHLESLPYDDDHDNDMSNSSSMPT